MTSLHAPQGMQGIEKSKKKFLERSNAEMAANKLFFCLCVNKPNWPRFTAQILSILRVRTRLVRLINTKTKE